jgi:dipeptidase D
MSEQVRKLEPNSLWNHFADLNAVPRPSKKEERVIQFMVDFGKGLDLETHTDKIGNIIIKKPATSGMEDRQTVILQSLRLTTGLLRFISLSCWRSASS